MKGRMNTEFGSILIDTDVIATYAGSVACGVLWHCRDGDGQYEGRPGKTLEEGQFKAWHQCHAGR